MADRKIDIIFELDSIECNPVEWRDIDLTATYDDFVQPVLITDEFTFVGRDAARIQEWFSQRPFEGMPFNIQIVYNNYPDPTNGKNITIYSILDFYEYRVIDPYQVKCKIKIVNDLDLLNDRIKAVSFGYLAQNGIIRSEDFIDVPVIVRKKFDFMEVVTAEIALYMIGKELNERIQSISKDTIQQTVTALAAPLQKPAEFFRALAEVIIALAYMAAMIALIIRLYRVLITNVMPLPTKYKAMTERKLLEKACKYFGIELDCNIPEIDYTVFMPSKNDNKIRANRDDEGIPNASDYGYQIGEFFELILKKYNAKSVFSNNKLIIRTESDEQWFKDSGYIMPDVLTESYRYNTDEMKANKIISFQYDPSDEWTMPNARERMFDSKQQDFIQKQHDKGVAYEVITDLPDALHLEHKLNRGLYEVRIPQALAARKNTLTALEITMKVFVSAIDVVIKLFGGKTFGEKINEWKGNMIISAPSFFIPKSVVIKGGLIPLNHRDLMSARALYRNYHKYYSFKENADLIQRKIYTDIKIPFDFFDFLECKDNSYFTTFDGKRGKFTKLKWSFDKDYAIADFWIAEKYMNENKLSEQPIET